MNSDRAARLAAGLCRKMAAYDEALVRKQVAQVSLTGGDAEACTSSTVSHDAIGAQHATSRATLNAIVFP